MSRSRKKHPFSSIYNGNDSDDRRIFRRKQRHRAKQRIRVELPEEYLYPIKGEAGDQGDIHSKGYWSKRDAEDLAKDIASRPWGGDYWENLQTYLKEWYRGMRK